MAVYFATAFWDTLLKVKTFIDASLNFIYGRSQHWAIPALVFFKPNNWGYALWQFETLDQQKARTSLTVWSLMPFFFFSA